MSPVECKEYQHTTSFGHYFTFLVFELLDDAGREGRNMAVEPQALCSMLSTACIIMPGTWLNIKAAIRAARPLFQTVYREEDEDRGNR